MCIFQKRNHSEFRLNTCSLKFQLAHVFKYDHVFIMSHSLLWRHIVLLTVGVYSSNHRVLYTIVISMTRRFQKRVGPSVRLSVCPFVTLTKKAYSSFIIDSRKIFRISGERVWHPLQENEAIFSKNIFQTFQSEFSKNYVFAQKCLLLLHY